MQMKSIGMVELDIHLMQPSRSIAIFDDFVERRGNRTSQLIVVKTPECTLRRKNQSKVSQ